MEKLVQTLRGVFQIAILGCALCIVTAFYYCIRDCISINKNRHIEISSWSQSSRGWLSSFPKSELICIAFLVIAPFSAIYNYMSALPEGTYCFSAIVESSGENYILPAQVRVLYDDEDQSRTIFLARLYWPNGGYIEFDKSGLEFDEKSKIRDCRGVSYGVTITKDRAICLAFDEDVEPKYTVDLWITGIVSICAIALLLPKYFNKSTP